MVVIGSEGSDSGGGGEFDTSAEEDRAAADTIDELNSRRVESNDMTSAVAAAAASGDDDDDDNRPSVASSSTTIAAQQCCDGAAVAADATTAAAADEENGVDSAGTPSIGYASPAVDGAPVGRMSYGAEEEEEPAAVDRLQEQPVHGTADERPTGNVYVRRDDMNYHLHNIQLQHQQHASPPQQQQQHNVVNAVNVVVVNSGNNSNGTISSSAGNNNNNNSDSDRYDMLVAQTYQPTAGKYASNATSRDLMAAMFPQTVQQQLQTAADQQRDDDDEFYEYQQHAFQQQQQQTKFEHIVLKQEPHDRVQHVYSDEYFHQDPLSVQLQQQENCSSPGSSAGGYDDADTVVVSSAKNGELLDLHLSRADDVGGSVATAGQSNAFAHLVAVLHSDSNSASPLQQGHMQDDQQQQRGNGGGSPTIACQQQQAHVADHSYTPASSSVSAEQQLSQHVLSQHGGYHMPGSNVIHHNSNNSNNNSSNISR